MDCARAAPIRRSKKTKCKSVVNAERALVAAVRALRAGCCVLVPALALAPRVWHPAVPKPFGTPRTRHHKHPG